MILKLKYKKLKLSDYKKFRQLFNDCFDRKISLKFFKWRYLKNKSSFCYGAFKSSELIANVGLVSNKLNTDKQETIFSRHSSMVLKKYRDKKIYSNLLNEVKRNILKKNFIVAMWPNKNNFSNFGIDKKKIIEKRYFLYQTYSKIKKNEKLKKIKIENLIKFKKYLKNSNDLFFKEYAFFKKRYLFYRKDDYFINEFRFKNLKSFFIMKYNKINSSLNYVILDHFGSKQIKANHLSKLISENRNLIFLSNKRINNTNIKMLNLIYFKIGFTKDFNLKYKNFLNKKEISLGDTDIFITLNNTQ